MPSRITSPSFFIGRGNNELISFGSGQPDLPPPKQVFEPLKKAKYFRYGLVQGEEYLRAALAKEYPGANSGSFVITNGASEALDLVLRAISKPKAKVLLPKPYYYSYPHNVRFVGMTPAYYTLRKGKIDLDNFKTAIKGCSAVIINSPSNPTGSVQDMPVLKEIERYVNRLGIYLISDEVYKDLIYGRENYLIKGRKVITINSFSKTYAMCGLRVGYLYARDREVIEKIIEMKTHTSMNTNILAQEMAYEATLVPRKVINAQTKIWEERRDLIYKSMTDMRLDLWKPEGAFYVFPKFRNPNRVMNELYYKQKMITYDGTWFGDPNRLRFSYALDVSKIEEGMKRLKKFLGTSYKKY